MRRHAKSWRSGNGFFPAGRPSASARYFDGTSEAGGSGCGCNGSVLTWGEPMDQVKEELDAARAKAAQRSRTIRFGMRIHFIVWKTRMTHVARPTG
jgi:alkanesulfonate monooxygenase